MMITNFQQATLTSMSILMEILSLRSRWCVMITPVCSFKNIFDVDIPLKAFLCPRKLIYLVYTTDKKIRSYNRWQIKKIYKNFKRFQVVFKLGRRPTPGVYSCCIQVIFKLYSSWVGDPPLGHIQVVFKLYSSCIQVGSETHPWGIFKLYSSWYASCIQVVFRAISGLYLTCIQVIFKLDLRFVFKLYSSLFAVIFKLYSYLSYIHIHRYASSSIKIM